MLIINSFKRFPTRLFSVMSPTCANMEEGIKKIFYASVNAVKPSELITKNKLIKFCNVNNREILEINQGDKSVKYDVTDKKIHLGKENKVTSMIVNSRILLK